MEEVVYLDRDQLVLYFVFVVFVVLVVCLVYFDHCCEYYVYYVYYVHCVYFVLLVVVVQLAVEIFGFLLEELLVYCVVKNKENEVNNYNYDYDFDCKVSEECLYYLDCACVHFWIVVVEAVVVLLNLLWRLHCLC